MIKNILTIISSTFLFIAITTIPVMSYSPFLDQAQKLYNNKNLNCELCHIGSTLNFYGKSFKDTWIKDKKITHTFKIIENLDSDADGFSNIEELLNNSNPGDKLNKPKKEILLKSH